MPMIMVMMLLPLLLMMLIVLDDDSARWFFLPFFVFHFHFHFHSICFRFFSSQHCSMCVVCKKLYVLFVIFIVFSVRLWLLFLSSMDALECIWCNGNRYVDLIQTRHFPYTCSFCLCVSVLQQRVFHMMLLIAAHTTHTHTRILWEEYSICLLIISRCIRTIIYFITMVPKKKKTIRV